TKPFTVKEVALRTIAAEVKKATRSGTQLIIGHGAGSFGHVPAKKYQTHKGLVHPNAKQGIVEVANAARQLNDIVLQELIAAGVLAVSVSPLSMMTAKDFSLGHIFTESIEQLLSLGLLPVVYGDQVVDEIRGCTIFSTETVLAHIALTLQSKGYAIKQIIHCGQTNGVYDAEGKTIPLINGKNFDHYKASLLGSNGIDVTGGMLHKVEETLALAQQGIPGLIIDGIEHGSLSQAVAGKKVLGTKIEK
ncbi:MAG: isopentenyl phosphate kinase, partial [bacterium]|nr:isopentenyl phosphate kinase [bacterium]